MGMLIAKTMPASSRLILSLTFLIPHLVPYQSFSPELAMVSST